jgi:hypothetical protein
MAVLAESIQYLYPDDEKAVKNKPIISLGHPEFASTMIQRLGCRKPLNHVTESCYDEVDATWNIFEAVRPYVKIKTRNMVNGFRISLMNFMML